MALIAALLLFLTGVPRASAVVDLPAPSLTAMSIPHGNLLQFYGVPSGASVGIYISNTPNPQFNPQYPQLGTSNTYYVDGGGPSNYPNPTTYWYAITVSYWQSGVYHSSPLSNVASATTGGGPWAPWKLPAEPAYHPNATDPINLATGTDSYEPSADLTVYNPNGPSVRFQRNYRTDEAQGGLSSAGLSPGWRHNLDASVLGPYTPGTWGAVTLVYPNGGQDVLTPALNGSGQPTGVLTPPTGASFLASGIPGGTAGQWQSFTITWGNQTAWTLTPYGNHYALTQITDRLEHSLNLSWGTHGLSTVTDASSGTALLTLAYDGNGNLASVSAPYGREVVYTVGTPSGLAMPCLLSVSQVVATGATNPPAHYTYAYTAFSSEPLLSAVTVPSPTGTGNSTSSISYDGSGRVASLADANGNQEVISYGSGSATVQTKSSAGTVAYAFTQNFDGSGRNTGLTDAGGFSTQIAYGDANNPDSPTTLTDKNGKFTQFTYDPYGNVLTVTSPRGVVTTDTYAYNTFALGRLTQVQEGTNQSTPKPPSSSPTMSRAAWSRRSPPSRPATPMAGPPSPRRSPMTPWATS